MRNMCLFWALVVTVLLTLFGLPGIAHAQVTVTCPPASGGTYTSITAALNAVGSGPATITVTGTCNENVSINNARSITIVAGAGGVKVVQPQDSDTFDISLSQDITLQGLEIAGTPGSMPGSGGGGVVITNASEVQIVGCNVHDNEAVGIGADTGSNLFLRRTTIQNNPGDGLDVTVNSFADVAFTTIQNNGNSQAGTVGVFVNSNSTARFRQTNSILNNADFGIQVLNQSSVGFSSFAPGRFTTVQGHNVDGIFVRKLSELSINGVTQHVITGNGAACPLDPTCGGIFAENNSTVHMIGGANVSGNQGSGVSLQQGTNLILGSDPFLNGPQVSNNTITNNTGDGVHVQFISIGDFLSGDTITGNGGKSVFCDTTSLAVGDLSGFSNVGCSQIARSTGQGRPGTNR